MTDSNDLFNSLETLPQEVQTILASWDDNGDEYKECSRLESEIEPYGYTFDWYLDGTPHNLRKIEYKWFYGNGELKGELPKDCVEDCSSQGDCTASVQDWIEQLEFKVNRNQAIKYLEEYGAWDTLESDTDQEITERVLWIACGDISEQGEWLGLIH